MAIKELTVPYWPITCPHCQGEFDLERGEARMAPDSPLILGEGEKPFALLDAKGGWHCPHCQQKSNVQEYHSHDFNFAKPQKKKVSLHLLVHPDWLKGASSIDSQGQAYGGSVQDSVESTQAWNRARAQTLKLIEVRGSLPETLTLPEGGSLRTGEGTVPKEGHFACGKCGTIQRIVEAINATGTSAASAPYAFQAYSPSRNQSEHAYGGRYFMYPEDCDALNSMATEWGSRKDSDLKDWWPRSPIPFGHMTHQRQPLPQHGYLNWADMFNPRQLLVQSLLLKAICTLGQYSASTREFVLSVFQQYLRNNNMFCFWNAVSDKLEPHFSNNNFHPKALPVENGVFSLMGRGNWASSTESLFETLDWSHHPFEIISSDWLTKQRPEFNGLLSGKSQKVYCNDPLPGHEVLRCGSATDLQDWATSSFDLVITDPPFGGLLHYSELSDFFYVWLRLALRERYPEIYSAEYTPKTMEVVANRARQPDDSDAYYQRLLTASWQEAHRILKPGGLLAFTFHHSEDDPWVSVLESLFDAGFLLEATYPIRSDETKGEGEFGSKQVEYDIIHVCRKRTEEPQAVSWAKMRRQVLADIRALQGMLELHQKSGLPAADLQVIRRGKALEYFSRHYGKVYVDEGRTMSVKEALVGIHQILDEEGGQSRQIPPVQAESMTRQFLRLFAESPTVDRDQMQKHLRGSGTTPSEFAELGWCREQKKVFHLVTPPEMVLSLAAKKRDRIKVDYEQALFLIGTCYDNSGINAKTVLADELFKPHPALAALLAWFQAQALDAEWRNAAARASVLLKGWSDQNRSKTEQLDIFFGDEV